MQRLAVAALIGATSAKHHVMHSHKGEHHEQKQHQLDAVDVKKLELIVGGILKGAIEAEGFTDIEKCINDAEGVFADAKVAVEDFEKKDVASVLDGIKEVAAMMQLIK